MERPTHEEGSRIDYVVQAFLETKPPRTWHFGTLSSCREWIKKHILPYAGKPPAPVVGIYKKQTQWTLDLVE